MSKPSWTTGQDAALRLLWDAHVPTARIAEIIGRCGRTAIENRARLLELSRRRRHTATTAPGPALLAQAAELIAGAQTAAAPAAHELADESAQRAQRIAARRAENDRRTRAAHQRAISTHREHAK